MHSQSRSNGRVAQLNRVADYGSAGYRFESCRGHNHKELQFTLRLFFLPLIVIKSFKIPLHLLSNLYKNRISHIIPTTFCTELKFAKMICHLSLFEPEPSTGLCSGDDRCRVTDTKHLSSVICSKQF